MTTESVAVFDALAVTVGLEQSAAGAALSEVHFFSYLACLISVYDGQSPAQWRYGFSSTTSGAPFAPELADAVDQAIAAGLVGESETGAMRATEDARSAVARLSEFGLYRSRARYIDSATRCCWVMPPPLITESISREPQLENAIVLKQRRLLLDDTGVDMLRPHFVGLRQALSEAGVDSSHVDLLVPTLTWLAYLGRDVAAQAV